MKVLVYDTETTDLKTDEALIQELACATFDVCEITGVWRLVRCFSELVRWPGAPPVKPEVEKLTGLSSSLVDRHGDTFFQPLIRFYGEARDCDAIAGQNILLYDDEVMDANAVRSCEYMGSERMLSDFREMMKKIIHIDSYFDLPLPPHIKQKALKYFALDHGYVMSNAHQAMADVFACAHIMSCYPIAKIMEIASTPLINMWTSNGYNDVARKTRLYENGFRWNAEKKLYEKKVREFYYQSICEKVGSKIDYGIVYPKPDPQGYLSPKSDSPSAEQPIQPELPF